MTTMIRDLAILAALIVGGLVWNAYRAATRKRGREEDARHRAEREQPVETPPLDGAASYAPAHGWTGPSDDPHLDPPTRDYVRSMVLSLWGVSHGVEDQPQVVAPTRYTDVYSGRTDGRDWTVANSWTGVGAGVRLTGKPRELTGSVCVVQLGETLPPLFVTGRRAEPFVHLLMKEVSLESEDFNSRYRVQALDRKYAMDVLSPRVMELVMQREDWSFFLAVTHLVCVCTEPFRSVDDVVGRLDVVNGMADLIPSFVSDDRAARFPTLPDGTRLDPTDPASRRRFEAALTAMSPQQREAFMAQAQAAGARFLLGMFGKDVPPSMVEDAARRVVDQREGGASGGPVAATPPS